MRYAAYANRIRTIMLSAQRYVAYTSDIGESFRPVAHPWLVRGAYAISWSYLVGDVAHEGYKAYCRTQRLLAPTPDSTPPNSTSAVASESAKTEAVLKRQHIPALEDYRAVMAQRAVFQSIASMGLPAFTIHSIVRYSGRALKNSKNTTIRTWGPIGVRLEIIDGWNSFTD
jgi:fission process protein 1